MTELEYKRAIIKKHSRADWKVETSPMDEYGTYVKNYIFTDGCVITEVNRPVWEHIETVIEVKGIPVKVEKDVKLFETEIWSTDDSTSKKFYELY